MSAGQADRGEKPFIDERVRFTDLSPSDAKRLGRKIALRKDWELVKVDRMTDIVRAKFEQNEELARKLLDTGDCFLVEDNDWGDRIWGQVNGQGANLLGNILMQVRQEIRERQMNKMKEMTQRES